MTKKIASFILLLFLFSISISAQEKHSKESHEHEFKKFRVAFAIGHGYIPSASSGGKDFLIIPVMGLDIQYWFNERWGLALKNDIEISNYIVDDKNDASNFVVRENPVIVSLPLLFSPWNKELTFIVGPGIEFEEHENFSIFRVGIGYEFEFGNHWDFAPEFIYDLKDGHINALTVAFGVGKRF